MTKDELLMPRFKVIAYYPGSNLEIGKVLKLDQVTKSGKHWHGYGDPEPIHLEEGDENKYPAIFRKLEWWEERGDANVYFF